jgi:hypothetical protein
MRRTRWELCCWVLAASGATWGCGFERDVRRYEVALEAQQVDELELRHGEGDVAVIGEEGREEILVIADLRSHCAVGAREKEAEDRVDIRLESVEDGRAELLLTDRSLPVCFHFDVEVHVPAVLALRLDLDAGDVSVEGVRALRLKDGGGDVSIDDIDGDVVVDDGSGDLSVRRVNGAVSVTDDSGDLTVREVDGDVVIEDHSGDLSVASVTGDLVVDDASGDLVVRHVTGTVTVRDGSGDIVVHDAGETSIVEDGSGDVVVD